MTYTTPVVGFASEAESAQAFDTIAESTGLFSMYKEVPGTLTQPRMGQRDKGVRIDRILVPTSNLIDAGWRSGIIGVEIKKNAEGIGPYLAQAMDYTRSVFLLPGSGFQVVPAWVFVWPLPNQHGPVASIMQQNRIGNVTDETYGRLSFKSGEANILRVNNDWTVRIGAQSMGQKVGSR